MQPAEFEAVAVVPAAVAVIVRQRLARRIVVAVHVLDDAIGIQDAHRPVGGLEECLQVRARQMPVRLAAGVGKRFVDVADHDVAGMAAHQPLHLLRLADGLGKLVEAQAAEQRQVGLRHQAEPVAVVVDFGLHGPLRQPQEVHVADLGEQDVVDRVAGSLAEHVLLLEAHRVGAAQPDLPAVEEHPAARARVGVLPEGAHAELAFRGVQQRVRHRRAGGPGSDRATAFPDPRGADCGMASGTLIRFEPGAHGERHVLVVGRLLEVADAGDDARAGVYAASRLDDRSAGSSDRTRRSPPRPAGSCGPCSRLRSTPRRAPASGSGRTKRSAICSGARASTNTSW